MDEECRRYYLFFLDDKTGKKFRLTIFRRKDTAGYKLPDGEIDFRICPLNVLYQLTSDKNSNGNVVLRQAGMIPAAADGI